MAAYSDRKDIWAIEHILEVMKRPRGLDWLEAAYGTFSSAKGCNIVASPDSIPLSRPI